MRLELHANESQAPYPFRFCKGGDFPAINLQNAQADLERNVFTNDASPAVKTSGAPVTLQCSSIQSGGVSGDAGLVVKENDFAAGVGVTAPAGASAEIGHRRKQQR